MNPQRTARSASAFALSLALLVAGIPVPAQAAPPSVDITGKILDQDGVTPVRDVIVRLKSRTSDTVYESKAADGQGQYRIPNVPDGEYSIVVVTGDGEFELPNRLTIMGGQPSAITVILTAAASQASRQEDPASQGRSRRKVGVLIPILGSVFVAAFAAAEYFEKDGDGSPKLP